MSRRRPYKSPKDPKGGRGYQKHVLDIYCTGGGKHGEERIAKVTATERPDLEENWLAVHVEGIGNHHDDRELRTSWEPRYDGEKYWKTHTFTCSRCGRDKPMRDDKLGKLVLLSSLAGKRRVDLSELS